MRRRDSPPGANGGLGSVWRLPAMIRAPKKLSATYATSTFAATGPPASPIRGPRARAKRLADQGFAGAQGALLILH